ncbi:MAG: gamma-glutamylcyclotransferase family protein [Pseudomonadota bacterium]
MAREKDKEINHLFVYGTLAPGRSNEHVLAPLNGSWQPATIKGKLFESGWGAAYGYPGVILDDVQETVHGFLFSCSQLADEWQMLDDFEGPGYRRTLIEVQLEDGSVCDAYVYALS